MPYFKNSKYNILYVHVPKTGGSSIEKYFSKLTKTTLNKNSLFGPHKQIPEYPYGGAPLQHLYLDGILRYAKLFKITQENLKIIISVRNPYTRMISALFYRDKINLNTHPSMVFKILKEFIEKKGGVQHHNIPQWKFYLVDGLIPMKNVYVIKNETLDKDMAKLGFRNFRNMKKYNTSHRKSINYYKFLNKDSIKLINRVYKMDFEIFGYKKIIPE